MSNFMPHTARWPDGPIWLLEKTSYIVRKAFAGFVYVPDKKHIYRRDSVRYYTVPEGDTITVLQKEVLTLAFSEMQFRQREYTIISWQEKVLCAYDYAYADPLHSNE